jgi:hypothetical protein
MGFWDYLSDSIEEICDIVSDGYEFVSNSRYAKKPNKYRWSEI